MTLVVNDRVQEVSTSTGSGPFVLGGGVTGFQTFSVGIGNTNSAYYTITNGTNWMDILGTYTSDANSITVDKILTSSAGGTTAVSFAAGTKNVFCTYPAATAVLAAPAAYPTVQPTLNLDFANSKTVDPRITFVRNSTATYYDGQTTAMAEQNLLLNSQLFTGGGWSVSGVTLGSAVTAPDGATTAYPMIGSGVSAAHGVVYSISSITGAFAKTLSIYVQAVSQNYVQLRYGGDATCYINFDLSTGLPGSNGTGTTGTITSVGSGWYRLSMTNSSASAANITVQLVTSSTAAFNEVNTLSTTVNIWGAQLEQRSAVTAYTPTTTAPITNYIPVLMTAPAGVARFDCDPITGKSLGLLIEESKVNLLDFSSSFATSGGVQNNWADTNITRTAAAFIAPDSTQVGIQFTASAANATVISTAAVGSSLARTFSVWLKRISGTGVINYTLDNGTTWIAQAITSTVTRYIFTTTTANQQVGFQIVTAGDSIGIWGAQLEAGSFATSYIPTVATTMTRAADAASMTGTNFSSWYNQAQGTVCVDYDFNATSGIPANAGIFALNNSNTGGLLNRLDIRYSSPSNTSNGVALNAPFVPGMLTGGNLNKIASSYSVASSIYDSNYGTASSYALTVMPTPITQLVLGVTGLADVPLNGHIRKLSYYPIALSSSNLVALTS